MKLYKHKYQRRLKSHARGLRSNQSDAEKVMWFHLRGRRLKGYKFRRQYPLDNYILDFYCVEKNLAIELDGGQHADNVKYDRIRTKRLNELGIVVLRFWNNIVLTDLESVLGEILKSLE